MTRMDRTIVVTGATGQQGGATARALLRDGVHVRALVRDPASPKAEALRDAGVELVRGDLGDRASIDEALRGAYGVFSVQVSSGQPEYGVTDEDEERFGKNVVDAARAAGVQHLVYTSVGGLFPDTGIGHFESKWRIEQYVRSSGVPATIVRPTAFMELLTQPHFGITGGTLTFFLDGDQTMQWIAAEDIGAVVARVFASPERHIGTTLEIAGDELTGPELAAKIGRATNRPLAYARFPDAVLEQSSLLRRLVELVAERKATGNADIAAVRALHPGLMTMDTWLDRGGAALLSSRAAGA